MPSVNKHTADRYSVRNVGEWATIYLNEWTEPSGDKTRHLGEIAINSSFGAWGHQWGHCGSPFREFLTKIDNGYAMSKLARGPSDVFDGEASMCEAFRRVIKARKSRTIDEDYARDLWNDLCDRKESAIESNNTFINELMRIGDPAEVLIEPWHMIKTRPEPALAGFMRDLWPVFIDALKAELAPPTPKVNPARCQAGRDGDCTWSDCPQLCDGEPAATGRHCPLDRCSDGDEA